mmetsp:Transcript_12623/g.26745  ORF Transcript_12623/g.26745 Transcript_12623/m.26745 type:complete len:405 (-) Transcript_12623:124-1338(-)
MAGVVVEHNVKEVRGLSGLLRNVSGAPGLVGVGFVDVPLDDPYLFDGDQSPRRGLVLEGPQNLPLDQVVALAPPRRIAGVLLWLRGALVAGLAFLGRRRRRRRGFGAGPGQVPEVLRGRLFRLEDLPAGRDDDKAGPLPRGTPGGVQAEGDRQLGGVFSRADVLLGDLVLRRVVSVIDHAVIKVVVVFFLGSLGDGRRPPLVLVPDLNDIALFEQGDRWEQVGSRGKGARGVVLLFAVFVAGVVHRRRRGRIQGSLLFQEQRRVLCRLVVEPHVFGLVSFPPERVDPVLQDGLLVLLVEDHGSFHPPIHRISEGVGQLFLAQDRLRGTGIEHGLCVDLGNAGSQRRGRHLVYVQRVLLREKNGSGGLGFCSRTWQCPAGRWMDGWLVGWMRALPFTTLAAIFGI